MFGVTGGQVQTALTSGPSGSVTHPEIPLVNARDVLKWSGKLGIFKYAAHVKLNCNIIYKSNVLDYKQDLPGTTNVTEPYEDLENDEEFGDLGEGNGEAGMCPALTTSSSLCETVDRDVVLNILDDFVPSWEDIQEAIKEVQKVYPSSFIIPHDVGSKALDKIDFGGGLIVDVIDGALGPGQGPGKGWTWIQECNCGQDGGPTN